MFVIYHFINQFAAIDLINTQKVQAILGPRSWKETSLVAEIGNQNHIPILSFADTSPKWAAERWPFLVQASPNLIKKNESCSCYCSDLGMAEDHCYI